MLLTNVYLRRVDHEIKGQGIYAYVTLAQGTKPSPELKKKLNEVVRNQIGSFAVPDVIHWAPGENLIAVHCTPDEVNVQML